MTTSDTMICPRCGANMNWHAEKLDRSAESDAEEGPDPSEAGALIQVFACPRCGAIASRRATSG